MTLEILDNYLRKPHLLIKEAKVLKYQFSELNPSNLVSDRSKYAGYFYKRLSKYTNKKIIWDESSGTFRKTNRGLVIKAKNELFVHSDGITDFISILYLSQSKNCHGGTSFFRHNETGLEGFHNFSHIESVMKKKKMTFGSLVELIEHDARHSDKWTETDRIKMKYNRLIIYNGRLFHSHIFDFKSVKSSSDRLTFVCFGATRTI
jgi:hypothetical protein